MLRYTPKSGVSAKNKDRVLINLHGGGFSGCWPGCAELESIPVSALGQIEVVSVDYSEGPDNKFPAASEDVASVYQELLKNSQAAEHRYLWLLRWRHADRIVDRLVPGPQPCRLRARLGFSARAQVACSAAMHFTPRCPWARLAWPRRCRQPRSNGLLSSYFAGTDPKDPLVSPVNSPEVLAKFPPTLIITGTRGFELSSASLYARATSESRSGHGTSRLGRIVSRVLLQRRCS